MRTINEHKPVKIVTTLQFTKCLSSKTIISDDTWMLVVMWGLLTFVLLFVFFVCFVVVSFVGCFLFLLLLFRGRRWVKNVCLIEFTNCLFLKCTLRGIFQWNPVCGLWINHDCFKVWTWECELAQRHYSCGYLRWHVHQGGQVL